MYHRLFLRRGSMLNIWFMIFMIVNVAFSANSFMSLEELLTQAQRWKVDVGFQFNQILNLF